MQKLTTASVKSTFLSSVLTLVACVLLPNPASAVAPSTDHDVVIVGAGAAGLYAAYTLDKLGYDVLIVEARHEHGGRIDAHTLGDVRIEDGAEELYGPRNNFLFDDIEALYGAGAQVEIFREDSTQDQLISIDGGNTCWAETGNCYLDPDIFNFWTFYSDAWTHDNDSTDELVSDYLNTAWGVDWTHRAYHLYEAGFPGGEYGTTVERLGLRSLSREGNTWSLSGNVYGLGPTGYRDALDTLYFNQVLPYVIYNSPVTVIDTSGIKPVAIDGNGVHHYAEAIIVTVSVGVLQAEIIDFIPDLPLGKVTAYNTIGMGNGMKISLRFSDAFWDVHKMMDVITEGPTGQCWPPARYQTGTTSHVLTCFMMGKNAEVMEALPDDTARVAQVLIDLDLVFDGQASIGYIDSIVHNWTADPYIRGSYSYPAPGTRPGGTTMRQVLAQPVGSQLYFAGEATHNTAPSTVPGALQSGERAAGEVDAELGGPPEAASPTADFTASVVSGAAPLDVAFSDLSTQNPTDWSWDFGDGGWSNNQHPNHRYTTPGTYTVSLTVANGSGSHTRVMPMLITVASQVDAEQSELSGSWYNPERNYEGFEFHVLENGDFLIIFYTYPGPTDDELAEQSFILGVGTFNDMTATIHDAYRTKGPVFGDAYDKDDLVLTTWGDFTVEFFHQDSARVTYDGVDGSGSTDVIRLTSLVNPEEAGSLPSGISGSWYDPGTNGQGWFVEIISTTRAVVYWYTYDENGNQVWSIGVGEIMGNSIVVSEALAGTGTRFGNEFNTEDVLLEAFAAFTLEFADCNSGTAVYSTMEDALTGSLPMERLTTLAGHPCNGFVPANGD